MTDQSTKRAGFTCFPEAPTTEPGVVAVLFTKGEDGNLRAYVKEYPGFHAPDPEAVQWLQQAVSIANL